MVKMLFRDSSWQHVRAQEYFPTYLEGRKDANAASLAFLSLLAQYTAHISETGCDRVGTIQVLLPCCWPQVCEKKRILASEF